MPPNPELPSVSDYDGNTYPVIEINGVKWLAANLRTTHYNDGTEIPSSTAARTHGTH